MADDIIKTAQELRKRDEEAWASIYKSAKADLRFQSDEENSQWDSADVKRRTDTNRPVIQIDQLGQFVHQVANDVRMNTPTINVIPDGDGADIDTAEFMKGKIKAIEYYSNADTAYDTAVTSAIKCSIGFFRVDHDYINDEGFEQELKIKRVVNPFAILLDSTSIEADGSDSMHGSIIEKLAKDKFKARFPGKKAVSFESETGEECADGEEVAICEFYKIVDEYKEIGVLEDGNIEDVSPDRAYKNTRKVSKRTVKRYTLSGADILEETTFPGKYVPIIPVYGEEAWEDGKRKLHSLIRKSKSAQRMHNYWASLETELLMKQPQAPVMAEEGQIDDYAEDWLDPSKAMVLRYKGYDTKGQKIAPPSRLEPPTIPTGIINARRETVDDIKATMGMYNAAIGNRGSATSGKQEIAQQREGDVATYHFGDNLVKSITHCGRILVCAIPEIIDTARVERIIGEEDEPKEVGVNGQTVEGQEKSFDLSKGKYGVRVITGAPFTTRRQETVAALTEVFKAAPELYNVMGDLYFKNSDFAGAPAMANRMKKVIDPKFLDEEDKKDAEPAPDPEKEQMVQVIQAGQAELQEMQQQIQGLEQQIQSKEFEVKTEQARSDLQKQMDALKSAETIAKLTIDGQKKDLEIATLRAQPPQIEQSSSVY